VLILFTNCIFKAYLFAPLLFKSEVLALFLAFGWEVLFDIGLCATTHRGHWVAMELSTNAASWKNNCHLLDGTVYDLLVGFKKWILQI
jgi:hypothetical protein